jgi:hypothetical protein
MFERSQGDEWTRGIDLATALKPIDRKRRQMLVLLPRDATVATRPTSPVTLVAE